MKQLIIENSLDIDETIELSGNHYHYLVHVRRIKKGDIQNLLTKEGLLFKCTVTALSESTVSLYAIEKISSNINITPVILESCFPKGKKWDLIIRQATEAGVKEIKPVYSENSLIKLDNKNLNNKMKRWNTIICEAMQQSGSQTITTLKNPVQLKELALNEHETGIFFHQEMINSLSISEIISSHNPKYPIHLIIGPEGGLSENEVDNLVNRGYYPAYLGQNVLRTETACISSVMVVKTLLREKKFWIAKK